jgi:hypothetical protein
VVQPATRMIDARGKRLTRGGGDQMMVGSCSSSAGPILGAGDAL